MFLHVFLLALLNISTTDYFFVIFKKEMQLELRKNTTILFTFRICALAMKELPKTKVGDMRTPEGIYRVLAFNPRSASYKSISINYPNAYDRARRYSGGSIGIHGKCCSVGCIGMSNNVMDTLFVLKKKLGLNQGTTVVILPTRDPRVLNLLHDSQTEFRLHYKEMLYLLHSIEQGRLPRISMKGYED